MFKCMGEVMVVGTVVVLFDVSAVCNPHATHYTTTLKPGPHVAIVKMLVPRLKCREE